ncbi:hypothetical protein [Streptomyces mirabilis]|uniref:hypothetical protein n=1 Tax=Streptomyces mirabilis TaxID=68239 RepID=UPI0033AFB91C
MPTPHLDCAGYVGETEADTGGVPIKVCQQDYPDTRMTFLAVLTGTDGGSSTVCITENAGA